MTAGDEEPVEPGSAKPPSPEVYVPGREPAPTRDALWLVFLALAVFAASLLTPAGALSCVVPWGAIVATLFAVRVQRRQVRQDVRIGPAGIRATAADVATFTPWSDVTRLADDGSKLVAELENGGRVEVDLSSRPDVRAILDLAPKATPYARVSPPAPVGMKQSHKTLLLWALLVVLMVTVWRLVDAE